MNRARLHGGQEMMSRVFRKRRMDVGRIPWRKKNTNICSSVSTDSINLNAAEHEEVEAVGDAGVVENGDEVEDVNRERALEVAFYAVFFRLTIFAPSPRLIKLNRVRES